jgi:hypothetical protein
VYYISEDLSMSHICENKECASARGNSSPCLKPGGSLRGLLKDDVK